MTTRTRYHQHEERITFPNSHKQDLCGVLSVRSTKNAIIICHGLGSSKDDAFYVFLQERLNAMGVTTLRMDLLGHGESHGEFDDLTLTETIDDVLCAKRALVQRGYARIGFIGSSFGAVGGIIAASREPFDFLVFISPPTHYDLAEMVRSSIHVLKELMAVNKTTTKKKAHLRIGFFWDYGSHDSFAAAARINAPVLIVHGDADRLVPLAKSKELCARIVGASMTVLKGADHHYTIAQPALLHEIITFVAQQGLDAA